MLKGDLVCVYQTKHSPVGICLDDSRYAFVLGCETVHVYWGGKSGHRADVNTDVCLEDVRDLVVIPPNE